MISIFSEAFV